MWICTTALDSFRLWFGVEISKMYLKLHFLEGFSLGLFVLKIATDSVGYDIVKPCFLRPVCSLLNMLESASVKQRQPQTIHTAVGNQQLQEPLHKQDLSGELSPEDTGLFQLNSYITPVPGKAWDQRMCSQHRETLMHVLKSLAEIPVKICRTVFQKSHSCSCYVFPLRAAKIYSDTNFHVMSFSEHQLLSQT